MTTTNDQGAKTLDAVNIVIDNDFVAYCHRLRLVLDAASIADGAEDTGDDVPRWRVNAAEALRDWYRDDMVPFAFQCAETRAHSLHRQHTRERIEQGEISPSQRGVVFTESLSNAAVALAKEIATDALDGVPWKLWLEQVSEVLEAHDDWAPVAIALWPVLKSENPREADGSWSAGELAERTNYPVGDVDEALKSLSYHGITADRFVGGTSGSLHFLRPADTLPEA